MKRQTLFLALLLSLHLLSAQNLQQTFSFQGHSQAIASNILQTSDGGYLLVGSLGNDIDPTKGDLVLIKTDAQYQPDWHQRYYSYYSSGSNGIPCNPQTHLEYAATALETTDGYLLVGSHDHKDGLLCAGPNTHLLGDFDVLVSKVDRQGQLRWTRTYGNGQVQMATGAIATRDGGFLISGFGNTGGVLSPARPWFLKLDVQGEVEWSRLQSSFAFQGVAALVGVGAWRFPVIELQNGHFLYLASSGDDSYLVKLNAQGNLIWAKKFFHGGFTGHLSQNPDWGIGAASYAFFHSLIEQPNGNLTLLGNLYFALAVVVNPNDPLGAFFAIGGMAELDSTGNFVKGSVFTHPTGHGGTIFDMITTDAHLLPNGNYLIGGLKENRSFLLEYDLGENRVNRHSQWARQFGPYRFTAAPFGLDLPSLAVKNGRAALFYDDFKLAVTDLQASPDSCGLSWGPIQSLEVQPFSLLDVSSSMQFQQQLGYRDSLSLRSAPLDSLQLLYPCNSTTLSAGESLEVSAPLSLYPNPIRENRFHLAFEASKNYLETVVVYDVWGKIVLRERHSIFPGENRLTITLPASLPTGHYYLRIGKQHRAFVKK